MHMAGFVTGDPSHHGTPEAGSSTVCQDMPEEVGRWYMSRREIEENSPSRKDGVDLKKETYLRKSYCTFLQDLGMRLKVPQVTIATAIIFCHRFFLRQSHAKNDRRTIATVCMFLAGKVEETPRPLKDVILVSYEIIHKKDPTAVQRIKQKEVYEQQKELILLGERVVLTTLAFDLNVHHPYKPLVEAIKKFKVAQNALAQVAWNFVNDGLRTSLCLQFKPHHIAAGAIFLAAKFLKVKLPSDGEKVWWQEFDVTPRQLEEVSNQMLELYEQNRVPPSQGSEMDGSTSGGPNHRAAARASSVNEEQAPSNSAGGVSTVKPGTGKQLSRPAPNHLNAENFMSTRSTQNQSNDNGSAEMGSVITDQRVDGEFKDNQHYEKLPCKDITREGFNRAEFIPERIVEDQERSSGRNEITEAGEYRDTGASHKVSSMGGQNLEFQEDPLGQSSQDAMKMIDKDKVKARLEKMKKFRGDMSQKKDLMDEDDLIEKALEDGVELATENERMKQERRQNLSKIVNPYYSEEHDIIGDRNYLGSKELLVTGAEVENVEEGEMLNDASPMLSSRGRKGSPLDRELGGKPRHDVMMGYHRNSHHDAHGIGSTGHAEREHRRHAQDNHL